MVTSEGQHKGWNHPLQLGVDYTGRPYGASIHRTEMRFVDVQPGDVIVLGKCVNNVSAVSVTASALTSQLPVPAVLLTFALVMLKLC